MDNEKDKGKDKVNEPAPCCSDPSKCQPEDKDDNRGSAPCCGPGASGGGCSSLKIIKSIIFFVVVFVAIGMAGRSIFTNQTKSDQPWAENKDAKSMDERILCGVNIQNIGSLNDLAVDKDFVFLVVPGEDKNELVDVSIVVDKVSKKISEKGTRVGVFNLDRGSEDYDRIIKFNKINSFPAVLAMGKGCGSMVIQGEITEEKLMEGYTSASKPSFSTPGGRCCP